MFSSTAYEALYQYIGLELHARFIEVLTSQPVFMGLILIIFAMMFFTTTVQFFSRYLPGVLIKRKSVALSQYVRIIVCLIIGLSVLRVGSHTGVKRWDGNSWHTNGYVTGKSRGIQSTYRVSLVFDLLSRTAEETTRLLNQVIDGMFRTSNSEIKAPSFFYKAIMYAGSTTLEDPDLRSAIGLYTDACITRALPMINERDSLDRLDGLFRSDASIDQKLAGLELPKTGGQAGNCLSLKNDVQAKLIAYTRSHSQDFRSMLTGYVGNPLDESKWLNLQASMALVDLYLEKSEGFAGIQKGSQPEGGAARVFQYINRFFSWDGLMSLLGKETHGAALAAERSQEFSENLTRAPHVAGFIKLALIAIFPWLVFPIVAGRWKALVWWFVAYSSVLLWTPIWTLFYHIVTGISLSAETLAAFGELADGISLYSANLVTSRMNYMYAVYSWMQLLIGAGFTGSVLWFARPILADSQGETAPEFIGDAGRVAGVAGKVI